MLVDEGFDVPPSLQYLFLDVIFSVISIRENFTSAISNKGGIFFELQLKMLEKYEKN